MPLGRDGKGACQLRPARGRVAKGPRPLVEVAEDAPGRNDAAAREAATDRRAARPGRGVDQATAFEIDPKNPDPGRVTVRRLNRVEYRNTIRDLMGVDFNADAEFPPDDTGHGFDNIGDVLTLSPLLLEKYIAAARTIVAQAVPTAPRVPAEKRLPGRLFGPADAQGRPTGSCRSPTTSRPRPPTPTRPSTPAATSWSST